VTSSGPQIALPTRGSAQSGRAQSVPTVLVRCRANSQSNANPPLEYLHTDGFCEASIAECRAFPLR
jgi:hypothetical protein